MKKPSQAAQEGPKAAAWLLERAPRVLFDAYVVRPGSLKSGETKSRLRSALFALRRQPESATAQADVDRVVAEIVAEAEERTFFAVWHFVMALLAGDRRG